MHMNLNDGRRIELVDWEDRSTYDVVNIRSPNFPPRYFGEYFRSRERKKHRNDPVKRTKPHRVIPVNRSKR